MNSSVHCCLSVPWANLALWAVYAMVAMPTPYCCSIRPFSRVATPSIEVGTSERLPSSARGLHGREACPAGTPPKRSGRDDIVGVIPPILCISTVKKKSCRVTGSLIKVCSCVLLELITLYITNHNLLNWTQILASTCCSARGQICSSHTWKKRNEPVCS